MSLQITNVMNKTPKAIFFDLDETLIENKIPIRDLFASMYNDFDERLGDENQTRFFEALRTNAAQLWNTMFDYQTSPEQQFVACFEQSINATRALQGEPAIQLAQEMFDHFTSLSSANVVLNDGALETLAELSNKGIITGLITNGIEQLQLGKIHQLELQHKVDHVTVSAQARAHKPHHPVFDLALSRAKVSAEQAWQIGDHATNDVAGAIRAGMGGVFYNPLGLDINESFSELDERPTHTVTHLKEVLQLI